MKVIFRAQPDRPIHLSIQTLLLLASLDGSGIIYFVRVFSYCCLYFFLFNIRPPLFYCLLYLLHLFHCAILSQCSVHSFLPFHSFNHLLPIALHISSTRSIGPSTIYSLRSNNIFLLPSAFLPFVSFEHLSAAFLSTFRSFSSFIYFCFVTLDVALLYNFIFSLLQAAFYLK